MLTIQELIQWQPDALSEDHLTNFVREFFKDKLQWHVAYHNPPSGSWKEITLIHNQREYLQEIHKRGVDRMKRPDLVAQYLDDDSDSLTLLLFESKQDQSSWDPELPNMMKYFFEGKEDYDESAGIRNVPFWHYRRRDEEVWNVLDEDDPDRRWFKNIDVSYVYGFGYLLGITPPRDLIKETEWMTEQLSNYESAPPIVVMAVGWDPETYEPYVATVYSETFPKNIQAQLDSTLPTVSEDSTTVSDFKD